MADFETVTITGLPDLTLALSSFIESSNSDGKSGKANLLDLANFIAPYVSGIGGSGYIPITSLALPSPEIESGFSLAGPGEYIQTTGPGITILGPLSVLYWDGETWVNLLNIPFDFSDYATKNYISEIMSDLTTKYDYSETPAQYGVVLNKIYNGDDTISTTSGWDYFLFKAAPHKNYKIKNESGIPIVYMAFLKSETGTENNVIEFRGDGVTPISGDIIVPEDTLYIASDFLKNSIETTQATYSKTSFSAIDNDSSEIGLPKKFYKNIVFNSIMNGDGSVTTGTSDWDYVVIPVEDSKSYDVVGLRKVTYIGFYSGMPFSESTIISFVTYNDTQRNRHFTPPAGSKYAVLDIQKTGTLTNQSTYKDCYYLESGVIKEIIMQNADNRIVCWGNSMTQGNYALDQDSYEFFLAQLLPRYNIINCGAGGENSYQIAGRQGGIPMYFKNSIIIPPSASTTVALGNRLTDTSIYSLAGVEGDTLPIPQGTTGAERDTSYINPIILDGILCSLTMDEGQNMFLNRLSDGQQYTTLPKTIINTRASRELRNARAMVIFCLVTNDTSDSSQPWDGTQAIIEKYEAMIEYNGSPNVIVVSEWSELRLTVERMAELELALLKRFGARLFNLRKYAVNYAMSDLGLTPSTSDQERMNNGLIPLALTIDGLHPNTPMYRMIANQLYNKMIQTGMVNI